MKFKTAALVCAFSLPAVAQAQDWEYAATIYGWVPGLDATIGTAFGDVNHNPSGGDILSNLDMAFMGTLDASNGRWGVIGDLLYVKLSDTKNTPFGVLFANADLDIKVTALSGYVSYRFFETSTARYDVVGGFRYFDLSSTTTLNAGTLATRSASIQDSWADPVAGFRGNWAFDDKWSATGFIDYGSSGGSSETWQVLATVNYEINGRWAARVGYRHMDVSQTIGGTNLELGLSGPIFGMSYRF